MIESCSIEEAAIFVLATAILEDEDSGRWVTIDGAHVFISDKTGTVTKGPEHLLGKQGPERLVSGSVLPPKDKPVVVVFGGSFNPPHEGHVAAANKSVELLRNEGLNVTNLVVAPTADKLIKNKLPDRLPLEDRTELTRLMFADPSTRVTSAPAEEAEAMQGKLRRTQLADWASKEYPGHTVVNVTGEDAAPGHPPGYPSVYQGDKGTAHEGYYYLAIGRPQDSISSSKIRRAVAAGDNPQWMNPEAGRRYLEMVGRKKIGEAEEEDGHWVTIDGAHVFISNKSGTILKGPSRLIGKPVSAYKATPMAKHAERPDISKYKIRELAPGQTTKNAFMDPKTGQYDAERTALHEEPLEHVIDGKVGPTDRAPVGDVLLGGTAVGKTTYSNNFIEGDPNKARIDNDEIKMYVPEFEGLKISDPEGAAGRVHDEASDMTHDVLNAAIAHNLDFVYDSTTSGTSGPQLVSDLADRHYEIHLTALDAPISQAIARADYRSKNSPNPVNIGRKVSDANISKAHYGAAANFFQMKDDPRISQVRMFDTTADANGKITPRLIYERIGSNPEKIYDPERFDRYRQKAVGLQEAFLDG